jgi:hypothetical protein
MATTRCFEDLEVWQLARELSKNVYRIYTNNENFSKDYKLKEQINAASGSVMDILWRVLNAAEILSL